MLTGDEIWSESTLYSVDVSIWVKQVDEEIDNRFDIRHSSPGYPAPMEVEFGISDAIENAIQEMLDYDMPGSFISSVRASSNRIVEYFSQKIQSEMDG